jgi:mannose-6-phosphate isomerase-like protein (cupin superfamily)
MVSERFMPEAAWHYTQPHVHDTDEVNLILSPNGCLRYRYEIDGAVEMVESPSSVFIPAGTPHRMEAAGGTGIFICIHLPARRE